MKIYNYIFALILTANTLLVQSKVTFKVIAVNGKPSVVIDGKEYKMVEDKYPIYKTTVDVNPPVDYHYALETKDGDEEEDFIRTVHSKSTLNEFFNRKVTVKKHPLLPMAYKELNTLSKSKLFDDTFVATILIEAKENDLKKIYESPFRDMKINAQKVIYVSPYSIKVFNKAGLKISGQSSVYNDKLSYKISTLKTDDKEELFDRTGVKLRAEYIDPTFLKEKTHFDMLNTLGVPTSQSRHVRLFINKEPIGLFLLTEDFSNKRFHRSTFNNGVKYSKPNAIIKVNPGGKLSLTAAKDSKFESYTYQGDQENEDGSNIVNPKATELVKEILGPFMNVTDYLPNSYDSLIKDFKFDVDSFLRAMVMEYLGCAADNYWSSESNYFIFKDMTRDSWHFIDSDFDGTFGFSRAKKCLDLTLDNFSTIKEDSYGKERPFIDGIRKISKNKKYMEEVVKQMVKVVFNPKATEARINSLVELIREDAYWDFTLPRKSLYKENHHDIPLVIRKYSKSDFDKLTSSSSTVKINSIQDNSKINPAASVNVGSSGLYPIKQFIKDKSEKVASIYKIKIQDKVSSPYGYFEPKYEIDHPTDVLVEKSGRPKMIKTRTIKTATTTVSSLPTSTGKCGPNVAVCSPGLCCSKYGYCGTTEKHCGTGCQSEFGQCDSGNKVTTTKPSKTSVKTTTTINKTLPTSTGKCGPNVAVCRPGLCCSKYGYCGTTEKHCGTGCQSEFGQCGTGNKVTTTKPSKTSVKTTTTINKNLPTSTGKCGPNVAVCRPGLCCSKYGYCGTTEKHCGTGCQSEFGQCGTGNKVTTTKPSKTSVKTTTTINKNLPTSTGKCGPNVAVCRPGLCCSKYGYCGTTEKHCGTGCQSEFGQCGTNSKISTTRTTKTTKTTKTTRTTKTTKTTKTQKNSLPTSSGKCGPGVAVCAKGLCCSKYGYCGKTEKHCGTGCQSGFGQCN